MSLPDDLAGSAASALRARLGPTPPLALVLGSGLGAAISPESVTARVPFAGLPGFREAGVPGHAGDVLLATLSGTPALVFRGRLHAYEGHDLATVVHPVRTAARLDVSDLVLTCAAGGIREDLVPGRIVAIRGHLDLSAPDPRRGWPDRRLEPRLRRPVDVHDPELRTELLQAARRRGVDVAGGVYARFSGPSYETPAEIRALRVLGADLVGMSVVPEVLAARRAGIRAAALAVVTNRAAGLGAGPLCHGEVLASGRSASRDLGAVLEELGARRARSRGGGERPV